MQASMCSVVQFLHTRVWCVFLAGRAEPVTVCCGTGRVGQTLVDCVVWYCWGWPNPGRLCGVVLVGLAKPW